MSSATVLSLQVDTDLRTSAESVLREGETLSSFAEVALRDLVRRRQGQGAFLTLALCAAEDGRRSGLYDDAALVHDELQRRLEARRQQVLG